MASFIYDKARQKFLDADIDWSAHNIKLLLVKSTYTPVQATDDFLSIIAGANRLTNSTSGNFAGKTSTAGVADADDVSVTPDAGQTGVAIVIYRDSGVEATSELIAYIDTGTGLPITTNGAAVDIIWSSGATKIFKL